MGSREARRVEGVGYHIVHGGWVRGEGKDSCLHLFSVVIKK